MQRFAIAAPLLCAAMLTAAPARGEPLPYGGYVYEAPSVYRLPPYAVGMYHHPPPAYYVAPLPRARLYQPLPPAGFGSPYYNGYNDPYFPSYGPGMREFLHFGGADFYGW